MKSCFHINIRVINDYKVTLCHKESNSGVAVRRAVFGLWLFLGNYLSERGYFVKGLFERHPCPKSVSAAPALKIRGKASVAAFPFCHARGAPAADLAKEPELGFVDLRVAEVGDIVCFKGHFVKEPFAVRVLNVWLQRVLTDKLLYAFEAEHRVGDRPVLVVLAELHAELFRADRKTHLSRLVIKPHRLFAVLLQIAVAVQKCYVPVAEKAVKVFYQRVDVGGAPGHYNAVGSKLGEAFHSLSKRYALL